MKKLSGGRVRAMVPTSCGPGLQSSLLETTTTSNQSSHIWILSIIIIILFVPLLGVNGDIGERNKNYDMQTVCKNSYFLQSIYKKIEGSVLWSRNERNLDCVITFQTHSILQRFMLRFDMLQLDCNDHLYIYDGAHATSTLKYNLSCRNTKQMVGAIFTQTNYITLKYVTDGWGTDTNGFKLIITAIRDPKHSCHSFRCAMREFCIHPNLMCDGVNHCGDNSDEALCQNNDSSTLLGLELPITWTWIVLVAVSSFLAIGAGLIGMTICFCRRAPHSSDNHIQLNHAIDSNGATKYVHTLYPRQTTATATLSGNLHHPAVLSGYFHIIQQEHNLLMAIVRPIWCLVNY